MAKNKKNSKKQSKSKQRRYWKQYYQQNKKTEVARRIQYHEEHKEADNVTHRQYHEKHKEADNETRRQYHKEHKEADNEACRQYHKEHKEADNETCRQYYEEHKEADNENRMQYHEEHKEAENETCRLYFQKRSADYVAERKEAFSQKGTFVTEVSSIPCDTTEYELALSPETAVMNWYQCVGNWRLQWLLEDIQDLKESDVDESKWKPLVDELTRRLLMEKVTPEKQSSTADEFFRAIGRGCSWGQKPTYDEKSVDARLFGCACCGMKDYNDVGDVDRIKKFQPVPLSRLSKLLLSPEDAMEYQQNCKKVIEIPTNEEGKLKKVRPWLIKGVYCFVLPDGSNQTKFYHLHPELILKSTNDQEKKDPRAVICTTCMDSIDKDRVPINSLASSLEMGDGERIGLEELTVRELHMVSFVRYYYNIIKIESNSRRLREHQQSAIKGSTIMFEQDAPEVVSELLTTDSMNSNVILHFVGYKGEFDVLYKKLMRSKTADVFGRSWVLYSWLKVWLAIDNPVYEHRLNGLRTFEEFKVLLEKTKQSILTDAMKTFDNKAMEQTAQMKDDIAGVRATTNPSMQANHDTAESNAMKTGDFAMKFCLLASDNKTPNKSSMDSSHIYLTNAAQTMGINVEKEKSEYNKAKSYRSQYPVNEFTDGNYGLVAAFPQIFMFGKAYKMENSNLSLRDCIHLLMQFNGTAARCPLLLFFLYDIQRRHNNIKGMASRHKKNPAEFEELAKEVSSSAFHAKVRNAVADPKCKDAKYVLNKLTPVLVTANKNTTFGALEKNTMLGETYALIRRFGPSFAFVTIAFDDVNCPHTIRLTFRQPTNDYFPSTGSENFLQCMKEGTVFAEDEVLLPLNWSKLAAHVTRNPVTSAFMYKRLLYYTMKILIGLKPAKLSDEKGQMLKSRTYTTLSLDGERGGVVAGHAVAASAATETSGRMALHLHALLWSAITPLLLQGAVDVKQVCTAISEVLDSMLVATLPREYHVKYLIEKELPYYPTKNVPFDPLYRRPKAMVMPPNPTDTDTFMKYVNSAIAGFNIHSHDKYLTGRCHKPPTGLTRCSLTKPSGIVDRTKPVQLIDTTRMPKKRSEKITISYRVRTKNLETRSKAISSLLPRNRIGPLFRERDPRLIVYEPKRPALEPLPELSESSNKQWIVSNLMDALNRMDLFDPSKCQLHDEGVREEDLKQGEQIINEEQDLDDNLMETFAQMASQKRCADDISPSSTKFDWKFNAPEALPKKSVRLTDIKADNLNLLRALITSTYGNASTDECMDVKHCIINYIDQISTSNEECQSALNDWSTNFCLFQRQCVTPASSHWTEDVDAFETFLFCEMRHVNLFLYADCTDDAENYHRYAERIVSPNADTKCLLFRDNHYLCMLPVQGVQTPSEHQKKRSRHAPSLPVNEPKDTENTLKADTSLFMNSYEIQRIFNHLIGMNEEDLKAMYDTVRRKLVGHNGYVVDFNPIMTAILGCHTNPMFLGSAEQSKGAAHYLGPYVGKGKVNLADSLDIVYEAMIHAHQQPSIASDTGTPKRFTQHMLTRILNTMGSLMEISDTQAAAALLGLKSVLSSEIFVLCDVKAYINMIKNEKAYLEEQSQDDVCDDWYEAEDNSEEDSSDSEMSFIEQEESPEPSSGVLQSLLNNDDVMDSRNETVTFQKILSNLKQATDATNSPQARFYYSSYGSCPLYPIDDGKLMVVIPYPLLYRFRGKELRYLNRMEYYSTIQTVKDKPDSKNNNTPSHLQYKRGRKAATKYKFDKGIEIWANHHQVVRSHQCTPKLFTNPPAHPGTRPDAADCTKDELRQWQNRADRFAEFYLTLFRPEIDLYAESQTNTYGYKWDDLVNFVTDLTENKHLAINRFRLDAMLNMINTLQTSNRTRAILSDYRARNATRWSDEEIYENVQHYKQAMRKKTDLQDELDAEHEFNMQMSLGSRAERAIMQKVSFADGLLNQLRNFAANNDHIAASQNTGSADGGVPHSASNETYPVVAGKYDIHLAQSIADKTSCNKTQEANRPMHPQSTHSQTVHTEAETEQFIQSKQLSDDKLCIVHIMCKHFEAVRSGAAQKPDYIAPFHLITGAPGVGKSWLIKAIAELAARTDLEKPIDVTYMGIAAINIDGYTFNTLLNIPTDVYKGGGSATRITAWDPDRLQLFKNMYDMDRLSVLIIDEVSMVKPWMLAYIDARLKEATQVFDKPFGGIAVLMFGDFDQQPPIGGSSMPHFCMRLLEKEYQKKHNIFFSKQTKEEAVEMNSSLCRTGARLFQQAGHIRLSTQHRCANDPLHSAFLTKMNSGAKITPTDLLPYQTFSSSDMKDLDEFLYSTIVVTGNYERQELNAFVARLWAVHYNTHVIRWKRKIQYDKWKGKPRGECAMENAEEQNCFYEYFVPRAPGYLTDNVNLEKDLANGTFIRMDSLAFDTNKDCELFERVLNSTPIGETVTIPEPPKGFNVELYPDFPHDTPERKSENATKRAKWKSGSLTDDGRIVIHIDQGRSDFKRQSIRPGKHPFYYAASVVPMSDYFPIELGFCITVPKAQGRTISHLIVSLSEHPCQFLKFRWEQVYVVTSRIPDHRSMKLLLQMGDRATLQYISNLEKDAFTTANFKGFRNISSSQVSYWDFKEAAKAAGFVASDADSEEEDDLFCQEYLGVRASKQRKKSASSTPTRP